MQETKTRYRPYAEQGRLIKKARKRTGLSQDNFAPRVGTTPRHLIRLENGEHRPGPTLLVSIARETGETVEAFGYPSDDEEEDALRSALSQVFPPAQASLMHAALVAWRGESLTDALTARLPARETERVA